MYFYYLYKYFKTSKVNFKTEELAKQVRYKQCNFTFYVKLYSLPPSAHGTDASNFFKSSAVNTYKYRYCVFRVRFYLFLLVIGRSVLSSSDNACVLPAVYSYRKWRQNRYNAPRIHCKMWSNQRGIWSQSSPPSVFFKFKLHVFYTYNSNGIVQLIFNI